MTADTNVKILLDEIHQLLDEQKAENIKIIDLHQKTPIADFMIVASGLNKRHVSAIADKVSLFVKHNHNLVARSQGHEIGEWAIVDCLDIIVHVFTPEKREEYKIEQLWQEHKRQ
jgi:ribosome-associated protein